MKNISIGVFSQIIIVLLGLISRKVFVDSLGIDYLGIDGLLTNVIAIMALVESGIGISIVYNLYKPLAENDKDKVTALIQLYKKAYKVLAIIILVISIVLFPFLMNILKDADFISNISFIYFLFVVKNMISYLNAHKWSLINADQKGYVLARMNLLFQVSTTIAKIIILVLTQNYILYLIIELFIYLLQNIVNGAIVNKRYPYIKTKVKYFVDKSTMDNLVKNVKAMFLHNIGGFLVFGTDNILIASFISVATVGLYSNYTMIINQLSALVKPILGGIGASVGNLITTESNEKTYSIFKIVYLVNFWIFSLCVIFLYNLLEPFITWWLGKELLLEKTVFIVILLNFYLTGMRTAIATFKDKAGLFVQDKYAPLIEGGINLISSLVLVKYYGLAGIFMGTTISTITTIFWTQPCIVYKHVFMKPVQSYFIKYGFFAMLTFGACFATTFICTIIVAGNDFISLVIKGMICLIVPNLIYICIFYKNAEFQYLKNIFTRIFTGLKVWIKMKRIFDLFVSLSCLLTFSLIMVVIAIIVRFKLGSPIIFKQQRPGLYGKPFFVYKFRTMTEERDSKGVLLSDQLRLTSFGQFLRKYSLDELPQLINVIKGDLSLVGPRPLLMEYLPLYTEEQAKRHHVRPGITGWAQVNGRNAITWEDKFKLDVWYVENQSFSLDLKIIYLTIVKVFKSEGISQDGHTTVEKYYGTKPGVKEGNG